MSLKLQKEFVGMDFESLGNPYEDFYCGRAFAALDPTHVIGMNISPLRKRLLTEFGFPAVFEHGFPDDFAFRFGHYWLRKQKRRKVTTHAQCRMGFVRACNLRGNDSERVSSRVGTLVPMERIKEFGFKTASLGGRRRLFEPVSRLHAFSKWLNCNAVVIGISFTRAISRTGCKSGSKKFTTIIQNKSVLDSICPMAFEKLNLQIRHEW